MAVDNPNPEIYMENPARPGTLTLKPGSKVEIRDAHPDLVILECYNTFGICSVYSIEYMRQKLLDMGWTYMHAGLGDGWVESL